MANVNDAAIRSGYDDVRDDKSETNFVLIDYESDKSNTLHVTKTGSGGLTELIPLLEKDRASFAFVRVKYANDEESFREKFILVIWIGEGVKIMRRAKMSVHTNDVKSVWNSFSLSVNASTAGDLKEDDIVVRLRKAGGASYDKA